MERVIYEKLIAEYAQELTIDSLIRVLNMVEVLRDKETLHKRLEMLRSTFNHIVGETIRTEH